MSEQNGGLPPGWALAELGALSERRGGGTPSRSVKRYFQGNTPWLTVADLPPIGAAPPTIVASREAITDEAIAASSAKPIPKDSVVFATRVSIGKVAIAGCTLATNQDFRSLLPGPAHEPSYIAWFLSHIAQFKLPANQGTTIKGITTSKFDGIEVPLPPLAEQRRIVAKIEALQERSRRAREALSEVGPLLEQFRQSVLAAAFRGDLTADWRAAHQNVEPASGLLLRIQAERRRRWEQAELTKFEAQGKKPPKNWKDRYEEPEPLADSDLPELPAEWAWCQLGLLGDDPLNAVQTGPFGAQLHRTEFTMEGVPVIAVGNLTGIGFTKKGLYFITEKKAKQLHRYDVQAGDLLFARSGATLGKVCVAPSYVNDWRMTGHILRARLNRAFVLPEIVAFALWGDPAVKSNVTRRIRGMTRPGYNTSLLQSVPIPLPPIDEQRELLGLIFGVFSGADDIASFVQESLIPAFDHLDQATLAKAFRGELVPQDASDEPASVLLDGIRAQRTQQAESAKQTSKSHQTSKLGKKLSRLEPEQLTLAEVLRTAD